MGAAGAFAIACSSSSSGGGSPATDGGEEGGEDTGTGGDSGCTPGPNVATFDAGNADWSCIQGKCDSMGLTACGADCVCDNAVLAALQCVQTMGAAQTMTCFTNALTPAASNAAVAGMLSCLETSSASCGGPAVDAGEGGAHEGGSSEAGTSEGGSSEAGTSEAGTSEGGTEEGGTTDGGTEGGSNTDAAVDAPAG